MNFVNSELKEVESLSELSCKRKVFKRKVIEWKEWKEQGDGNGASI